MKKKNKSLKLYLIIMSILLIIIIITWIILWLFLSSYEKSNSDNLIKNIINDISNNNYNNIIDYVIEDNIFYTKEDYLNILNNEFKDKELLYRVSLNDDNNKTYNVYTKDMSINFNINLNTLDKKGMFNQNRWSLVSIDHILPSTASINIIVPSDVEVSVNNIKLSNDFIINDNYIMDKFNNIKNITDVPKLVNYEMDNIYIDYININIIDKLEYNKDNNTYYYKFDNNEELLDNVKDRLNTICENYTRYVIKENNFYSISPYVLYGTNVYNFLSGISSTNIWSGNHTKANITDIVYSNMQVYNNNLFSVDATYTYNYYVNDNYKEYNTNLTLYMLYKNNNWYLVDLNT